MKLLHETEPVSTQDKWFVCGGNPSGNGGGVIGTRYTLIAAQALQKEAIKQNYTRVRVLTWEQLHSDEEE